jgi:hypothetical protein
MPTTKITTQTLYEKEGDDFIEIITLPSATTTGNISGYSNWDVQLMDDDTLTTDVSAAVTSAAVVVYDNNARQIQLTVNKENTDNIVASGSTQRTLFSDVQADDESGDTQTLVQLQWIVRRKYRPAP